LLNKSWSSPDAGFCSVAYRGEVAFCSKECREQQIEYDERMEQSCSLTSVNGASGSGQSRSDGGTFAAA
jgi:hypothetical protein